MEASPRLRLVELPTTDHERSRVRPDLAQVSRARLRRLEHPAAAGGRELHVAVEVPVEERTNLAGRVRDESVQRHRRSGIDRAHRSRPSRRPYDAGRSRMTYSDRKSTRVNARHRTIAY